VFREQITQAVASARSKAALNDIHKTLYRGVSGGALTWQDAEQIEAEILARKSLCDAAQRPSGGAGMMRAALAPERPRRRPQSPDRERSADRRRRLSTSGPMPPAMASNFTDWGRAVMRVVGDEWLEHGQCDRTLGEIAARAGVGVTTARDAIKHAERLGFLSIEYRPRPGQKSLPNVVRIISPEWIGWLQRGPRTRRARAAEPIGSKLLEATGNNGFRRGGSTNYSPPRSAWCASRRQLSEAKRPGSGP
jgi:hypothetical protein